MHAFLGCLFILIFGVFLFIIGIFRLLSNWIFGGSMRSNPWNQARRQNTNRQTYSNTYTESHQSQTHTDYTAGNAHHENRGNSRRSQNGKIFDKNEGEYVDFEEV